MKKIKKSYNNEVANSQYHAEGYAYTSAVTDAYGNAVGQYQQTSYEAASSSINAGIGDSGTSHASTNYNNTSFSSQLKRWLFGY